MRRTLFEIESLTLAHALLIALVLGAVAVLLVWREQRLGRVEEGEFGKSIGAVVGMVVFIVAIFYAISQFVHPIQIRSYGVMLMFAFAAGIGIAMARAPLYRIDPLSIIDLSLFILFASIIGSRLLYIILNWGGEYAAEPSSVFNIWEGGLAFHGGLIGGTLGGYLFTRWRNIRPMFVADLVAPSLAFGYAVARIGCFLNGCCQGGPCSLPWAVNFIHDDVPVPVHPTQLYSSIGHVVVGMLLLAVTPRIRVPGHLGLWYLVCTSVVRMFNEFFRREYSAVPWGPLPALTQAQAASIAIIVVAVALIIWTRGRVGYPLPEGESAESSDDPARPPKRRGRKQQRKGRGKRSE